MQIQKNGDTLSANSSTNTLTSNSSVSYRKIIPIEVSTPKKNYSNIYGNRIIDVEILSDIFQLLCCPTCHLPQLKLGENISKKKGLASLLYLECVCGYSSEFYTSKTCGKGFDINGRAVYSMRACGQGHAGLERFSCLMNLPKPMTHNNYDKILENFVKATKVVAEDTISDAVAEIREAKKANDDDIVDTSVSCDGTWQRRGYSSLNGVVTSISIDTGKILDCEAMSRSCKACKLKEALKRTDRNAYDGWKASHNCKINYLGSAPGMEVTGAKRIFNRSIDKSKLRFTEFYGDGDCKSFASIENTYAGIKVKKLECIGHVQKRVGTRLRKLKKNEKGLGFGVYDAVAVANFNIGRKASVLIYEKLGLIPGYYTLKGCSTQNKKRLFHSGYKNKLLSKKRRKVIRGATKKKEDVDVDNEGTLGLV